MEDSSFYAIDNADQRFFLRHMRSPVVAAIARLAAGRPLKILEIGCGSGADSVCLALHGFDVTTVDISAHMLDEARKLAERAQALFPSKPLVIRFHQGDVFDLSAYEGGYDVVLCFGVLVIWRELEQRLTALRNLCAALAPGGTLVLGTANTIHPLYKMLPVKKIVADLADHDITIMEQEVAAVGLRVVSRGALGLSANFEQWLSWRAFRYPLLLGNAIFERLPLALQIPVAPRVFVVARQRDD